MEDDDPRQQILRALEGRTFDSQGEADAFVERLLQEVNSRPRESFHGLTPEQMHRLLWYPFESPDLVAVATRPSVSVADVPAMRIFEVIAGAIDEKGLRLTAVGNVPPTLVREAAAAAMDPRELSFWDGGRKLRSESDYAAFHKVRIVAGLAGLHRKEHGRLFLTKECRKSLGAYGAAGVYRRYFEAQATKFNWGYLDGYRALQIVQSSFLFTLYLLTRYGEEPRPASFYADAFLRAFPRAAEEADTRWRSAETYVRDGYRLRALAGFAAELGLAELHGTGPIGAEDSATVMATPLLRDMVRFSL